MDEKLNGGALLIGSLLWDTSDIRVQWRDNSLVLADMIPVSVPIRYGRLSESRKNTFSMVFSTECKSEKKKGQAFIIPFSKNSISTASLQNECTEMIKAEYNKRELEIKRFNWKWGCLAICVNPNLENSNSEKNDSIGKLLRHWSSNFGKGFTPNQYRVGEEIPIVSTEGILLIDWPSGLDNLDFLIATVTKPDRAQYPTPKEIANAMIENNYSEYFSKNHEAGIVTFQDREIKNCLK